MVGSFQMEPKAERIAIPTDLLGKPAAVFFLLNELEQRKARAGTVATAPKKQEKTAVSRGSGTTQPLVLTDEFLFDSSKKGVELPLRRRS